MFDVVISNAYVLSSMGNFGPFKFIFDNVDLTNITAPISMDSIILRGELISSQNINLYQSLTIDSKYLFIII